MPRMRIASFGWAVLVSMALAVGSAPRSFAQEIAPAGEYTEGLPMGGWMLYPSIFVGATYDTNINHSPSGTTRDSGTSARVSPRLVATYDGGIYKTTVYGVADAQFFNANTVAASVGFTHGYAPLPDLSFGLYGNYTRQTDLFNSALMFNNNAIGPTGNPPNTIPVIINPFGVTPSVNPIAYNQFTVGASVTKTFDQAFVTLSASTFYLLYDNNNNFNTNVPVQFQASHDWGSVWLTGRVGYSFPMFYVFAEASGIWQAFQNSLFNTNGYRVVGGVGTDDPNSLWQAEVYGGWQFQHQNDQNCSPRRGSPPTPIVVFLVAVLAITRPRTGRLLRGSTRRWECRRSQRSPSGGNSRPGDHCFPNDDLWPLAAVVCRRPSWLYASGLHRVQQAG